MIARARVALCASVVLGTAFAFALGCGRTPTEVKVLLNVPDRPGACMSTETPRGVAQLCVDGSEGAMTRVTAVVGAAIKCVRVREEGTGHLGFLGSHDESDRNVVQLAPFDGKARFGISSDAFSVHVPEATKQPDSGAVVASTSFDLKSDGIRIEAYTRECWQVCESNRGEFVVELRGASSTAREQSDVPCTIVGPVAIGRGGGSAGAGVVDAGTANGGAPAGDAGDVDATGEAGSAGSH